MAGSLSFSNGGAQRVVYNSSGLDNLSTFTWVLFFSLTASPSTTRVALNKGTAAAAGEKLLRVRSDNTIESYWRETGGGTDHNRISSNTLTNGSWYCAAVTFDVAATPCSHIYLAAAGSVLAEVSYGTSNNGTPTTTANGSNNFRVGNNSNNNNAPPMIASIVAAFDAVLSTSNLQAILDSPRFAATLSSCKLLSKIGMDGTGTQADLSGNSNTGAVTSATAGSDGYPTNWCID